MTSARVSSDVPGTGKKLRPALSQIPTYSHSAKSRPFCWRQKPDTTLNFISSRHATQRKSEKKRGERKITYESFSPV